MDWTSLGIVVTILVLLAQYIWKKLHSGFDYFEKQGIPFMKPSLFVGSNGPILRREVTTQKFIIDVFNTFPDATIIGMFDQKRPTYMLKDPEVIKKLVIKDFEHFIDHQSIVDAKHDPFFGNNLFNMQGQKWKDMRSTLSPVFTGSKMRQMFDLIPDIGQQMAEYFKKASPAERIVEMKDVFGRFGLDTIASTNFGIKIDSLTEQENVFYKKAKDLMNLNGWSTHFRFIVWMYMKWLANLLKVAIIPSSKTNFFVKLVKDTETQREQHGIIRPDVVNLLMQIKKGQLKQEDSIVEDSIGFATVQEGDLGKITKRNWSDEELLAQAFVFFFGGFDTGANVSAFLAYELAMNPDVQQKLIEEVDMVTEELHGKKLTYEVLQKMKYMDMVVSEGLRFWPPVDVTDRVCAKDYKMKNDQGQEFTIEKGSQLWLPVTALHFSEKYFENPESFNPERFSEENKHKINSGAYLPFGIGPRNCIGSRYALMQVKAGFYYLLKDFTFEKTEKTQIPLELQKGFFTKTSEKGIWLQLKPRTSQ